MPILNASCEFSHDWKENKATMYRRKKISKEFVEQNCKIHYILNIMVSL